MWFYFAAQTKIILNSNSLQFHFLLTLDAFIMYKVYSTKQMLQKMWIILKFLSFEVSYICWNLNNSYYPEIDKSWCGRHIYKENRSNMH